MDFKKYNNSKTYIETLTIDDPSIYVDTISIIGNDSPTKAQVSNITHLNRRRITIELEWRNMTPNELSGIVEVLDWQNLGKLSYTYDSTEYWVYFTGGVDFILDKITELYTLNTTLLTIGEV